MRNIWGLGNARAGIVTAVTVALATLTATPIAGAATPPQLKVVAEFQGAGTFSASNGVGTDSPDHADVALKWDTQYTGTLESDGTLNLFATPGAAATAPPPGTFHYTSSGLFTADCSGSLPQAPGAPDPQATTAGTTLTIQSVTGVDQANATGQVICPGTDPYGDSFDESSQAASLAGAFAPYLPDVLAARLQVPIQQLRSGPFTAPVSDSDAVAQLPGSCADEYGESAGRCSMSLQWAGTVTIAVLCGTVTFSEGEAPPVGTVVQAGQTVATGPRSRLELTFADGAVMRLGPSGKVQCLAETGFQEGERSVSDNFKLLLGSTWAAVSDALGGGHEFDDTGPVGGTGVRGSVMTETILPGGRRLLHVIAGTGFVRVAGRPEFDFPPGEGVLIAGRGYTETTAWPLAAQAAVPGGELPPAISRLRVTHVRAGARATARFAVSEAAVLTVTVVRASRRVVVVHGRASRAGSQAVRLPGLRRGRYAVLVVASAHGRSGATQAALRVG